MKCQCQDIPLLEWICWSLLKLSGSSKCHCGKLNVSSWWQAVSAPTSEQILWLCISFYFLFKHLYSVILIDSQWALCDFSFHEVKNILNIFICCTFRALDPCVSFSSTENPLPEGLDLILQQCRIMGLLLQNPARSVSQNSFDFCKACLTVKLEVA